MKITHNPPQSPPMVRYGDMPVGALYAVDEALEPWIKCAGDHDVCLKNGLHDADERDDTLVIPLDAELVIHGWAGQVEKVAAKPTTWQVIADLRAELDRLTRERNMLHHGLSTICDGGSGYSSVTLCRTAQESLCAADRIRREAERGEEG